jgi:hypothetical protein
MLQIAAMVDSVVPSSMTYLFSIPILQLHHFVFSF